MLVALVASVALAASAAVALPSPSPVTPNKPRAQAVQRRNGDTYTGFFWDFDTPTPSQGSKSIYDARYNTSGSSWFALPTDDAGGELDSSGDKVGYRLTGDDDSAIVYTFSGNNTLVDVTYQYDPNGQGPSVEIYGTLGANYANTNGGSKRRNLFRRSDVWDNGSPKTVVMNKTVSVQNVQCDGDMSFTVTTLDANGKTLNFTGTNNLDAPVPTALPANVTVTNSLWPSALAILQYNGIEPVSVAFGSGNVPEPQAGLSAIVQYCPD